MHISGITGRDKNPKLFLINSHSTMKLSIKSRRGRRSNNKSSGAANKTKIRQFLLRGLKNYRSNQKENFSVANMFPNI